MNASYDFFQAGNAQFLHFLGQLFNDFFAYIRVHQVRGAHLHRRGPGQHHFDHVLGAPHAAHAHHGDFDCLGYLINHPEGHRENGRAGEPAGGVAQEGTPCFQVDAQAQQRIDQAEADGISLINTLMGMRIDLKKRRPLLKNTTGGLSGPAIFPVALRMVYQVARAVSVPVVGLGGVSSAEDVIEMMLAGATAVEVGAANLVDPFACQRIIADLPGVMDRLGIENLKDIIGGATEWEKM